MFLDRYLSGMIDMVLKTKGTGRPGMEADSN